jgi:small subunit ribosomal protein S8
MTDPIADFLTRVRNAQMARKSFVELPFSKLKFEIAKVMMKNEFLKDVKKEETKKFPILRCELANKKITLKRVSRPGQRIYTESDKIRKVLNGFGISIISTSKGVMTGYEARSLKIGGEVLCEVS